MDEIRATNVIGFWHDDYDHKQQFDDWREREQGESGKVR